MLDRIQADLKASRLAKNALILVHSGRGFFKANEGWCFS